MRTPGILLGLLTLFLCFALAACRLASPTPSPPEIPSPSPVPPTVRVTLSPSPLPFPTPTATPHLPPSMRTRVSLPYPAPTSLEDEILAALQEYGRVRAEAERTLNPELLRQVCVDPYLSEKMERIRANARDGSHWETRKSAVFLQSIDWEGSNRIRVRVEKRETKLFFPPGSSIPDDEICAGAIYSYRDCTYGAEYRMVFQGGRWYVAEARALSECPSVCRKGLMTPTPTPTPPPAVIFPMEAAQPSGWPALPLDLYFLRAGRLWRWPASGGGLMEVPLAEGIGQVWSYRLAAGGRYIAYLALASDLPPSKQDIFSPKPLYVRDVLTGRQVFPPAGSAPVSVSGYDLLPDGSHLVYLTTAGQLYILDLAIGSLFFSSEDAGWGPLGGYRLLVDGRYLACISQAKEMYILDLTTGFRSAVSAVGEVLDFDLSADGRYLVYLVEGSPQSFRPLPGRAAPPLRLSSGETRPGGFLFVVDIRSPDQRFEIGFCGDPTQEHPEIGCAGFRLSPDGSRVAFTDARGVWVAQLPDGKPVPLIEQSFFDQGGSFCGVREMFGWLPDSRGVLLGVRCYEGGALSILDTHTGQEVGLPDTWCYVDCDVKWIWSTRGVWVGIIPDGLYEAWLSPDGRLETGAYISQTVFGPLWLTDLHALADGRVGLAQETCINVPGGRRKEVPEPALFLLEGDGTLRYVAPLPRFPCLPYGFSLDLGIYRGSVYWAPDGSAFLYLDAEGAPMLLGPSDGSALWDVRVLLAGARDFHWARP